MRGFLIRFALVAAIAALAIAFAPSWSIWIVLAVITAGGIFINGLLATIEDDLPGGFNNPDGTQTPRYVLTVRTVLWAIASAIAVLVLSSIILDHYG